MPTSERQLLLKIRLSYKQCSIAVYNSAFERRRFLIQGVIYLKTSHLSVLDDGQMEDRNNGTDWIRSAAWEGIKSCGMCCSRKIISVRCDVTWHNAALLLNWISLSLLHCILLRGFIPLQPQQFHYYNCASFKDCSKLLIFCWTYRDAWFIIISSFLLRF